MAEGGEVRSAVDKFLAGLDRRAEKIVTALARSYTAEVQHLMETSPRGGRTYRKIRARGKKLRLRGLMPSSRDYIYHEASAPGEAPAPDKGLLINSVGFETTIGVQGFEAVAGSSIKTVPLALEFGTRNGRILPRPAFRPALDTTKQRAPAIIAAAVPGAGR